MIQKLTLEQISIAVLFIVGLIGGIKYLKKELETFLKKMLEDQFKEVNDKLDGMQDSLNKVDKQTCKNFLVRYLADIERGQTLYDSEKERFWEEYEHYTDDLGENSFVKEWVKRLQREGKL